MWRFYTDPAKLPDGFRFTSLNGTEICRFYNSAALRVDEETGELLFCRCECSKDETLRIPYGVRVIGRRLLREGEKSRTVILHYTVEEIEAEAFSHSSVEKVILNEGLRRIGENAFAGCHNIKSVVIPGSVEIIAGYAFYRCDGLEDLTIQKGVSIYRQKYVREMHADQI